MVSVGTFAYMHTDMHTYIHTYINTYILKYIHINVHSRMHACMHECMYANIHEKNICIGRKRIQTTTKLIISAHTH